MPLHTIIEQCLPKEEKHVDQLQGIGDTITIGKDGAREIFLEGANAMLVRVKSTIPTIVELLIAEIERYREFVSTKLEQKVCDDIINLLKQK